MHYQSLRGLDALLARLPFHLDDAAAVRETYLRWHEEADAEAKRHIDIWTYCYIRRYFYNRVISTDVFSATDVDELVAIAYRNVERGRSGLRQPGSYAAWVAAICRNSFTNYLRRRQRMVRIETENSLALSVAPKEASHEPGMLFTLLGDAIRRLPEYLQEVARLRLLYDYSIEAIAARTGKGEPTVRSYISKAARHLREDEALRVMLGRERGP